jgi:hypothetical protein
MNEMVDVTTSKESQMLQNRVVTAEAQIAAIETLVEAAKRKVKEMNDLLYP